MDPYEKLANAVILLAANDYRKELKNLKKHLGSQSALSETRRLERFFRSPWYSVLTNVDGNYLMTRIRKEVNAG